MDFTSSHCEMICGLKSSMRRNELVLKKKKKHDNLNKLIAKTQAKLAVFVAQEVLLEIFVLFFNSCPHNKHWCLF